MHWPAARLDFVNDLDNATSLGFPVEVTTQTGFSPFSSTNKRANSMPSTPRSSKSRSTTISEILALRARLRALRVVLTRSRFSREARPLKRSFFNRGLRLTTSSRPPARVCMAPRKRKWDARNAGLSPGELGREAAVLVTSDTEGVPRCGAERQYLAANHSIESFSADAQKTGGLSLVSIRLSQGPAGILSCDLI